MERWQELAFAIHRAIKVEGKNPRYHRKVLAKHRLEWPYLWKHIDELMAEVEKARKPGLRFKTGELVRDE